MCMALRVAEQADRHAGAALQMLYAAQEALKKRLAAFKGKNAYAWRPHEGNAMQVSPFLFVPPT